MMVWKMIFLLNWVIFRFHVILPGCIFWGAPNPKPHIGVRFGCLGDEKSNTTKLVIWADRFRNSNGQKSAVCFVSVVYGTCDVFMANMARDQQIQHMASWTYNYLHGKLQRTFRGNEIESIQRCLFVLTYHWQYFFHSGIQSLGRDTAYWRGCSGCTLIPIPTLAIYGYIPAL